MYYTGIKKNAVKKIGGFFFYQAESLLWDRDLARTCPARLLDRQFPENLLFGYAKISMKNFQFWLTNHLL